MEIFTTPKLHYRFWMNIATWNGCILSDCVALFIYVARTKSLIDNVQPNIAVKNRPVGRLKIIIAHTDNH